MIIPAKPYIFEEPKSFEILAYCSETYKDGLEFVLPSWIRFNSVAKIVVYTDWKYQYNNSKVEIIPMFPKSNDWIIGSSRRLDAIKHYSEANRNNVQRLLFMDVDCYMVHDVSEVFNYHFDIAISRLNSKEKYANGTATAGLWFARLTPGYFNFIYKWFDAAEEYKQRGIGMIPHQILFDQYSFTDIAKSECKDYKVLSINEHIYNSEHSNNSKWFQNIVKYQPKILHYKGRRFRNNQLVKYTLKLAGEKSI
jgi:hypothetical protein